MEDRGCRTNGGNLASFFVSRLPHTDWRRVVGVSTTPGQGGTVVGTQTTPPETAAKPPKTGKGAGNPHFARTTRVELRWRTFFEHPPNPPARKASLGRERGNHPRPASAGLVGPFRVLRHGDPTRSPLEGRREGGMNMKTEEQRAPFGFRLFWTDRIPTITVIFGGQNSHCNGNLRGGQSHRDGNLQPVRVPWRSPQNPTLQKENEKSSPRDFPAQRPAQWRPKPEGEGENPAPLDFSPYLPSNLQGLTDVEARCPAGMDENRAGEGRLKHIIFPAEPSPTNRLRAGSGRVEGGV